MNFVTSGGLGAVSFGISEAVVELVGIALLLAANRALREPARRSGTLAQRLQRSHLWVTVAYLVLLIAGMALATILDPTSDSPILGFLWNLFFPIQAFFAAAAVAIAVGRLAKRPI